MYRARTILGPASRYLLRSAFLFTMNGHFLVEADGTVKVEFRHEVGRCTGG